MPDYKAMYIELFSKINDVVSILQRAQQEGEKLYVDGECTQMVALGKEYDEKE